MWHPLPALKVSFLEHLGLGTQNRFHFFKFWFYFYSISKAGKLLFVSVRESHLCNSKMPDQNPIHQEKVGKSNEKTETD